MRNRAFFKAVAPYVVAAAVLILATLLVVAIYFTRLNLPWIAFLTGVLSAAIISLVGRASRAQWIITRREAKIALLQDKLARETRLRHELERRLADKPQSKATIASKAADTAAIEVSVESMAEGSAQDMFVQSLSEQMAGPEDAVERIMSAIEHNEFRLYCQHVVPLSADAVPAGHYEILIRLLEEEEGMMPPGAFFPLVEKYGLMPQLDRWVVQHVIEWLSDHTVPVPSRNGSSFFINLAAASLGDPRFPMFVRSQLELNKVPAHKLCFEITETDLTLLRGEVVRFAKEIQDIGCKIAVSNFGRKGVSFEPLYKIRASFLKIDGRLILDLLNNSADLAQVTAIARVAKTIDVKTIAELVESDACVTKLREIGVDYAQGFEVSTPAPLAGIAQG